jgi:hypothetical protein
MYNTKQEGQLQNGFLYLESKASEGYLKIQKKCKPAAESMELFWFTGYQHP